MKKNLKDLFDNFIDETVDLETAADISPEKIIEMTKNKIKEDNSDMIKNKKKLGAPLIAAAIAAALSLSVFAARSLLSPNEIADRFKDYKLAEYFNTEDTKYEFESQISKDYEFKILGIALGKNLSSFADVDDDKSYVVGAIARADGKALRDYPDIMVTPLVSGYKPWQVNAFTIGGGRQSFLYEGVDYFIFECNNIEIFADHTIYIAAYEGMSPSADLFSVGEDGSISFNEDYDGVQAMFTLPMDETKANPEAVRNLLKENGIGNDFKEGEDKSGDDFEIEISEGEEEKEILIKDKQ